MTLKDVIVSRLTAHSDHLSAKEKEKVEELANIRESKAAIDGLIATFAKDGVVDEELLTGILASSDGDYKWWLVKLNEARQAGQRSEEKVKRLEEELRIRNLAREEVQRAGR